MSKWGGFSPGFLKREYIEALGLHTPILGWTRLDWAESGLYARIVGGEVYYRPLPFENEDEFLYYPMIDGLPFEDQKRIWLDRCTKDGDDLQTIIGWMNAEGKRPIIQLFNEQWWMLDDLDALRRYAQFSREMSIVLWGMGASTAVWGGGMGWLNKEIVSAISPMLEVCRGDDHIAWFENHFYNPIHPLVWIGANQSSNIPTSASDDEKLAAIMRHPWTEPITTKEQLYPAWLGARLWGHPNGDGTYGFPELWDVHQLAGEGPVDRIGDPRLPTHGSRAWLENRALIARIHGVNEHQVGTTLLRVSDNLLNRLESYGAPKLRMAFTWADGWGWENYNQLWSPDAFGYIAEYLQEPDNPIEQIDLDGSTIPDPDPEPPPEDPTIPYHRRYGTYFRESGRYTSDKNNLKNLLLHAQGDLQKALDLVND